ncbi:MAG: hypothetical protein N2442_08285 [Spirochaetes bacterium]|nr:hypothetical protein [Spirochaetota bacterium]
MNVAAILEWILALAGGILLARWIVKVVQIAEEAREFYKKQNPDSFAGITE